MKKEIKKLWLEALRSGKYKQATGQLKRVDLYSQQESHCCLGVLCELHRKAMKKGSKSVWSDDGAKYLNDGGVLPERVRKWAGLAERDPRIESAKLTRWNDSYRKSFTSIADLIQEGL